MVNLWNFTEEEQSEGGRGTRLSCPERKELQEEGSGRGIKCCSNSGKDEEWKEVPGFGIRRLWEILESLVTALGKYRCPGMAEAHITPPASPCLGGCSCSST